MQNVVGLEVRDARVARAAVVGWLAAIIVISASPAFADNQTSTLSPVHSGSSYPHDISVRSYDFGAAPLATLHSFAAGTYDGKWVMLAGRTNGMHGFGQVGQQNFPPASQNKEVWVIDPVAKQSWHRSLETDPTITPLQLAELSSTNTQSAQIGNRLYVSGGYGNGPAPTGFQTYNALSSIDLPALTQWAMTGQGSASGAIRQIHDEAFRITGGAMYSMNGKMHLIVGQNFIGGYPNGVGIYSKQIRSFEINDDGVNFTFSNLTSTTPDENLRRRDLNVFPTLHRDQSNNLVNGLEILSGVFTPTNGAWTVPVQIDGNGQPSMADPEAPTTFKQAMNNYHSAKLGLFSEKLNGMHEVLFGGISLCFYDDATHSYVQDNNMPFINQITQVNIEADGTHTQDLLGAFPDLRDQQNNLLRFGANAEFFVADGIPTYDNGMIKQDELDLLDARNGADPLILGYIFGGIFSNAPHTQGVAGAVSGASNQIFEVLYTATVPEPAASIVLSIPGIGLLMRRRRAA